MFVSKKVIEVEGRRYASYEKLPIIGDDLEKFIVSVREVVLKESVYKHPIRGDMFSYTYEKVNNTIKRYLPLETWDNMSDVNTNSFQVYVTSSS